MWRPFASHFTKNTYAKFLKSYSHPLVESKPKDKPILEEDNQSARFSELQKKVQRQRLLIKQKDHIHNQMQKRQLQERRNKMLYQLSKKKELNSKIRAMADNKAARSRSYTPNHVQKAYPPPPKTVHKQIFSLTAAESTSQRIKTSRPLVPLDKFQEKLLKQFKDPQLRRRVQTEFDIIRGVQKKKYRVSVLPDIKTIRR